MSTNHNLSPWIEFRSQLCRAIDQRRSHLSIFTSEQIHLFINRCSTLFTRPGTVDARSALNRIQDEGTFLLVAKSLRDFLAIFPTAVAQSDIDEESVPLSAPPTTDQGTEPVTEDTPPISLQIGRHSRPSQPAINARQSSGRPFRPQEV